jgi:thiamine biosynthesis lipoprotein
VLSKKSSPKLKPKPEALPQPAHEWSFEAIGTYWWIGVYELCDAKRVAWLQNLVWDRIEAFDKTYSRFRPDSLVTSIAGQAGKYEFPADSQQLFSIYRRLYGLTDGAVTPLVGQLLSDAGYDARYSLQASNLHVPPAWDAVLDFKDGVLTKTQPVLLDFGAAGKGYLVDLVANELQKAGVGKYCVDASGDMVCQGLGEPLKIGLEHPDDVAQVIGIAELKDGALCGSAGNRRAWGSFTHIIDPKKLSSPKHLKAVWVHADNAMTADGLTTALYFSDANDLRMKFRFEHCMIYADGSVSVSSGFPVETFTKT